MSLPKGYKQTPEWIKRRIDTMKRIGAFLNKKVSEETRIKLSIALKGRKTSKGMLGRKHTPETIEKMRRTAIKNGNRILMTSQVKDKISKSNTGKSKSLQHRVSMSLARKGEKSQHWRGGVSSQNHIARESLECQEWRRTVFKRDNFTCIWCGQIGGKLNADHIKPFAYYPELRFAIDNGRTLCTNCHKKRHAKINTASKNIKHVF